MSSPEEVPQNDAATSVPPHRIAQVRQAQSITLRTVSRRSGVPVRQLRAEEESGGGELTLSALHRWARALDVPVTELLTEPEGGLTDTIAQRARLVRVMKTIEALRAHAESPAMRRIADRLRDQLLEIMPELDEITAWPREGSRRQPHEGGRVVELPYRLDRFEAGSDSLL